MKLWKKKTFLYTKTPPAISVFPLPKDGFWFQQDLFPTSKKKKLLPPEKTLGAVPMPIMFHLLEPIPTKGLTLDDIAALKQKLYDIMEQHFTQHA